MINIKNIKILDKISQGMYVLTTNDGGCVVDAVSQISFGETPLITVAVMKKNNTNILMKNNDMFALAVLGKDVNPEIIKTFGFNSMRDINKFEKVDMIEKEGLKIVDGSLGYMICEKVDAIENDTHTLFIGKVVEGDLIKNNEAMTYAYYQENKEELLKVKTENGETAWICTVCGYVYYGEEIPADYKCPICKVGKEMFKKKT